jgi:hypothetical protein
MQSYWYILLTFTQSEQIIDLNIFLDECTSQEDSCDRNARCVYNSIGSRYECQCNEGLL